MKTKKFLINGICVWFMFEFLGLRQKFEIVIILTINLGVALICQDVEHNSANICKHFCTKSPNLQNLY